MHRQCRYVMEIVLHCLRSPPKCGQAVIHSGWAWPVAGLSVDRQEPMILHMNIVTSAIKLYFAYFWSGVTWLQRAESPKLNQPSCQIPTHVVKNFFVISPLSTARQRIQTYRSCGIVCAQFCIDLNCHMSGAESSGYKLYPQAATHQGT